MRSTIHHTKKLLLELNAALNFMHDLNFDTALPDKTNFFFKTDRKKKVYKKHYPKVIQVLVITVICRGHITQQSNQLKR